MVLGVLPTLYRLIFNSEERTMPFFPVEQIDLSANYRFVIAYFSEVILGTFGPTAIFAVDFSIMSVVAQLAAQLRLLQLSIRYVFFCIIFLTVGITAPSSSPTIHYFSNNRLEICGGIGLDLYSTTTRGVLIVALIQTNNITFPKKFSSFLYDRSRISFPQKNV